MVRIDIVVCLLDADEASQNTQFDARQDPPVVRHLAFANWMRHHAVYPQYVTEALTNDSWPAMRWDRWIGAEVADPWAITVIDTAECTSAELRRMLDARRRVLDPF